MLEVRSERVRDEFIGREDSTHARTLENSDVGDMTKLSFVPDQEMRCWMPGSSSILFPKIVSRWRQKREDQRKKHILVELVNESCLDDFWLLSCRRSANSRIRSIRRIVPSFSAIGDSSHSVVSAMRARGRRGDIHRMLTRRRKYRNVSCPAGGVWYPGK